MQDEEGEGNKDVLGNKSKQLHKYEHLENISFRVTGWHFDSDHFETFKLRKLARKLYVKNLA
jgi:hypothetical protein